MKLNYNKVLILMAYIIASIALVIFDPLDIEAVGGLCMQAGGCLFGAVVLYCFIGFICTTLILGIIAWLFDEF